MMRWFFFCEGTIMERHSFVKRAYHGLNDFIFRITAIWIQFLLIFFLFQFIAKIAVWRPLHDGLAALEGDVFVETSD